MCSNVSPLSHSFMFLFSEFWLKHMERDHSRLCVKNLIDECHKNSTPTPPSLPLTHNWTPVRVHPHPFLCYNLKLVRVCYNLKKIKNDDILQNKKQFRPLSKSIRYFSTSCSLTSQVRKEKEVTILRRMLKHQHKILVEIYLVVYR